MVLKMELNEELESLSLEMAEMNKKYSDLYNRWNQLLVKWKKKNARNRI